MRKLLVILICLCLLIAPQQLRAALTKAVESVTDWTAVAQNAVGESSALDTSDHYATEISIQAFLDSTTAHTGTEFIIQVSSNTSGNEDWHDYTKFVALIDTANSEPIDDSPLTAGSTTIDVTDTGGNYEDGPFGSTWIAIEEGTLADSEICLLIGFTSNDTVLIQDGTANEHAVDVVMYDVAISKTVTIGFPVNRVRVIVNNCYDADGSSVNYRIRATSVSGI